MKFPRRPYLVAFIVALVLVTLVSGRTGTATPLGIFSNGACDDSEACNPGDPLGCRYDCTETNCTNHLDDDSDEHSDCTDSDCTSDSSCIKTPFCGDTNCGSDEDCVSCGLDCGSCPSEDCNNGIDDDRDGYEDGCDSDCPVGSNGRCPSTPPTPFCGDGNCDIGEGISNCPVDCGSGPGGGGPPIELCGDGTCNGGELCDSCLIDCGPCSTSYCGDGQCNGGETCSTCPQECGECRTNTFESPNCSDAMDNDQDGMTDCSDPDCAATYPCAREYSCTDYIDNNGDGRTDCEDVDCIGDPACTTPPEKNPFCHDVTLSNSQVDDILQSTASPSGLAADLGISVDEVSNIMNNLRLMDLSGGQVPTFSICRSYQW